MVVERTKPARVKVGSVVAMPDAELPALSSLLKASRSAPRRKRTGTHIHVSDLLKRCMRQKAIIEQRKVPVPVEHLNLMSLLTFAQGDAIHDVIKARAVAGGPSVAWGKWKCGCGSLRVHENCTLSEVDTSTLCDNCGDPADVYEEAEFLDAEYQILGHPDLILYLQDLQAFYVTELKSISHDAWKELARPDPDHVLQVLFYWWLMRRAGHNVVDTVSIMYITKGYVFKGVPYKEFVLRPQDELRRLTPYLEDAKSLLASRVTKQLPPRTMCVSAQAPDAKACPVAHLCFANTNASAPVVVSFAEASRHSHSTVSARAAPVAAPARRRRV